MKYRVVKIMSNLERINCVSLSTIDHVLLLNTVLSQHVTYMTCWQKDSVY